jgi:hypothetical protein
MTRTAGVKIGAANMLFGANVPGQQRIFALNPRALPLDQHALARERRAH